MLCGCRIVVWSSGNSLQCYHAPIVPFLLFTIVMVHLNFYKQPNICRP